MYYQRPLFYKILESVFRHKRLFFAAIITIVALLAAFVVTRPKTYTAQMTVVLNSQTITNPINGDANTINWDTINQTVNHFSTLVQTKDFLQAAMQDDGGAPLKLDHPLDVNNDAQVAKFEKGIIIASQGEDAFTISLTYSDPADCQAILASLIRVFIERNAQEKGAYYHEQVNFIKQQVVDYKSKLQTAEAELASFQHANAAHMPSAQQAIEQQLVTLNQQLQQYQLQLAQDQEQEKLLAQQLTTTPKTIVASERMGDSPLDLELKSLEVNLTTDMTVGGMKPNHPAVVALQNQITKLKQEIARERQKGSPAASGVTSQDVQPNPQYQYLFNQLSQLKISEKGLQAEVGSTQALISQTEQGVAAVPEEERTLANLQRDYSFNSDTYNTLLRRLQEAGINEQLNLRQQRGMYELYLTQPPMASTSKSKVMILFAGGIFLALIAGGALVLLSESMDRSFRDPYDMQRTLGVPVLAILPESADLHVADSKNPPLLPGSGRAKLLRRPASFAPATAVPGAKGNNRSAGAYSSGSHFEDEQIAGAGGAA